MEKTHMPGPFQDESLNLVRHDLANLLMMVRGYAELMLIRDGLDPNLRRYPEQIVVAVDRASAKLEQLRALVVEKQFFDQGNARELS